MDFDALWDEAEARRADRASDTPIYSSLVAERQRRDNRAAWCQTLRLLGWALLILAAAVALFAATAGAL